MGLKPLSKIIQKGKIVKEVKFYKREEKHWAYWGRSNFCQNMEQLGLCYKVSFIERH